MVFWTICRNLALAAFLALPLMACGASSPAPEEPAVQDIEPGQKSVIEPPARQGGQQGGIEERNI